MDAWWSTRRLLCAAALLATLAVACGTPGASTRTSGRDPCVSPGHAGGATPVDLLTCPKFVQPVYWYGTQFSVPSLPDLELDSSYTEYDEQPISDLTHVVLGYGSSQGGAVTLTEWYRPTWEDYLAKFTGYDFSKVPEDGPINWWQHPCVEQETYRAQSGAEVHLFRAHLDSLIRILPMSADEVASCLSQPVGEVGAHIYFDKTVIQLEAGTVPGAVYGSEQTVRYLAESLRPYKAQ